MKKNSGVLMPILSLPNRYGCGDFGQSAYDFIDRLKDTGFSIWQILPLQPLGFGYSPYQPYSSAAMDELYISLDNLVEEKLLTKDEVQPLHEDSTKIYYKEVREYKNQLLEKAYSRFKENASFKKFKKEEWVKNYAIFISLKKKNHLRPWMEWEEAEKFYPEKKELDLKEFEKQINYEIFVQYILLKQWKALKKYANRNKIKILGDIPFYVGQDSEDVWLHKDMFLLHEQGSPKFIAGCPPDIFASTGQRWGNPIYDWEAIEKDDFKFWMNRLEYVSRLYDITRIDHFRAFHNYWKIPATCSTAMVGEWVLAPGKKFFTQLFEKYPNINIVAEDLGDGMEGVYELRDEFHLKGMCITQQMFDGHYYGDIKENLIVYTGTHDNYPIEAWYYSLSKEHQQEVDEKMQEFGFGDYGTVDAIIEYTLSLSAETAILPIFDILRLGEKGRINTPGLLDEKNWTMKISSFDSFDKELPHLHELLKKYKRIR